MLFNYEDKINDKIIIEGDYMKNVSIKESLEIIKEMEMLLQEIDERLGVNDGK